LAWSWQGLPAQLARRREFWLQCHSAAALLADEKQLMEQLMEEQTPAAARFKPLPPPHASHASLNGH
jgi:hypothetical protein